MNNTLFSDGFVGERLTEAREAMGLSVTSVANLLGKSRQAIYLYEQDSMNPGDDVLQRICFVLDQPLEFFFKPIEKNDYSHQRVHFRAREATSEDLRKQAGVRLKWTIEYFSFIKTKLSLPDLNFPIFNAPKDPNLITKDLIEYFAVETRKFWGLDDEPIVNLINLLELNGVIIGQIALDSPEMDGLSFWSEIHERPFIILNSDKASAVRSRFDLAHELAHMILHRNIIEGVDRGTPLYKKMEYQAHAFASAFLLPKNSWVRDVNSFTLAGLKALKPKWRTSIAAMIMRSEMLGQISAERKTSLHKQYASKKWRGSEPYDNLWPAERPQLLSQATELLNKHGFGVEKILKIFPRRLEYLAEITGLPKAYFSSATLPMQVTKSLN